MPAVITQSQLLPILLAGLAFLVAALLVLYMFRLVFGRRVKAPGARNRPRRLDVVDAFDLDRDRQLVIVRRDNTEHLLMIGGPNDVVVEASINRIENRDARTVPLREKEPATAVAGWPAAPVSVPQPGRFANGPGQPPLGPVPVPAHLPPSPAEAKRKPFEPAPVGLQPLPPDLFAPAPPRSAAPPTPEPPPAAAQPAPPPRPPLRAGRGGPTGLGQEGLGPAPPAPPSRAPLPPFLARAQRIPSPAPAKEPPKKPTSAAPPPPAPAAPASQEAATPAKSPAPAQEAADPLEALEAEMARLLGRPDRGP